MKALKVFLFCMVIVMVMGLVPSQVRAATVEVNVDDKGFQPRFIDIHKGDTVRWTNTGTVVHSVTSMSGYDLVPVGYIDSGPIEPGAAFEQMFLFNGAFLIYDKYNTATGDGSSVAVDYGMVISPGNSVFSIEQGFDLAFHFNGERNGCSRDVVWPPPPLHCFIPSQCSIVFDGVEVAKGNCDEVFSSLNFKRVATEDGDAYMIAIPPRTLSLGLHSLGIKVVYPEGEEYSDEVWYRVLGQWVSLP